MLDKPLTVLASWPNNTINTRKGGTMIAFCNPRLHLFLAPVSIGQTRVGPEAIANMYSLGSVRL